MTKKILYIDMDGVIVDFQSGVDQLSPEDKEKYKDIGYCKVPGIFATMKPMVGALGAIKKLAEIYDVYILSSPGWGNASAWSDKYDWVNTYLPTMNHRLILSSQKHLNIGDYLIDDRTTHGASEFAGELVQFGTEIFKDWEAVLEYLLAERSCTTKVACGVVPVYINEQGEKEFLLIKSQHGKIAFPKGHVDPGETFLETARRELSEEVGISDINIDEAKMVTETYYFDQGDTRIKKVVHMFPGFVTNKQVTIQDEEVAEYYWLPENEALEKITFKEQKDSFRKMVTLLG